MLRVIKVLHYFVFYLQLSFCNHRLLLVSLLELMLCLKYIRNLISGYIASAPNEIGTNVEPVARNAMTKIYCFIYRDTDGLKNIIVPLLLNPSSRRFTLDRCVFSPDIPIEDNYHITFTFCCRRAKVLLNCLQAIAQLQLFFIFSVDMAPI